MTKIKFCGLRRREDISAVNEVKPDFAGFILCPKFWRYAENFEELRFMLCPEIKAVGVFVNDPLETVLVFAKSGLLDFIQLHGREDESYIKTVQDTGVKVIKAFKITSAEDLEKAYDSPADFVLLDSGTGTGKIFDWRLIKDFGRDYFLAGGLTPENVHEAVKSLSPYALDVSSGIETDKIKNAEKMRKFAFEARKI